MIPLFKVCMTPKAGGALNEVLYSGYVGQGKQVELFEIELCQKLNVPYLATVNSATSGLQLALKACGVQNKTVLTTPFTCIATNAAILAEGAKIHWVDINPDTLNIDTTDLKSIIENSICRNFGAVVVVHLGGSASDLNVIEKVANARCIPIIEDCAQAWGSIYKDKYLGCTGNLSVFSFQAVKPLTCGDGGAVVCPTEATEKTIKKLRWYGLDRDNRDGDVVSTGYKFHMNNLNACIGRANLGQHLEDNTARRREIASFYSQRLSQVAGITLLQENPLCQSSYFLYTMKVENRDGFIKKLTSKGIEAALPHKRNDVYTAFSYFKRPLPNLDAVYDKIVSIPCGWRINKEEQEYILDTILTGW